MSIQEDTGMRWVQLDGLPRRLVALELLTDDRTATDGHTALYEVERERAAHNELTGHGFGRFVDRVWKLDRVLDGRNDDDDDDDDDVDADVLLSRVCGTVGEQQRWLDTDAVKDLRLHTQASDNVTLAVTYIDARAGGKETTFCAPLRSFTKEVLRTGGRVQRLTRQPFKGELHDPWRCARLIKLIERVDLLKRFASFDEPPASTNYDTQGSYVSSTLTIVNRTEAFRAHKVPLCKHLTLDKLRADDIVCMTEQQFADWACVWND